MAVKLSGAPTIFRTLAALMSCAEAFDILPKDGDGPDPGSEPCGGPSPGKRGPRASAYDGRHGCDFCSEISSTASGTLRALARLGERQNAYPDA